MQSFERSTHGRNWIFTEPQLAELRHKLYEQTAEKLKSAEAEKGITTSNLTVLTADEEKLLREYYECKLQEICQEPVCPDQKHPAITVPKYTQRAMCTALSYFKRFFLKVSIVEENPRHMIFAALFLAGKVEEEKITLDDLLSSYAPKLKPETLLALEKRLLETLSFQLVVFSPFRALVGFLCDLQTWSRAQADKLSAAAADKKAEEAEMQRLQIEGMAAVRDALVGDVPMLYSPQQIALAVLRRVAKRGGGGGGGTAAAASGGKGEVSCGDPCRGTRMGAGGGGRRCCVIWRWG
mmetsp:Transcript_14146/g.30400  ORF Transcript_14146/g.30400 Transcript_14146/m.30400 type:complete len:295 (-) Transcript_14146:1468-2352(-)